MEIVGHDQVGGCSGIGFTRWRAGSTVGARLVHVRLERTDPRPRGSLTGPGRARCAVLCACREPMPDAVAAALDAEAAMLETVLPRSADAVRTALYAPHGLATVSSKRSGDGAAVRAGPFGPEPGRFVAALHRAPPCEAHVTELRLWIEDLARTALGSRPWICPGLMRTLVVEPDHLADERELHMPGCSQRGFPHCGARVPADDLVAVIRREAAWIRRWRPARLADLLVTAAGDTVVRTSRHDGHGLVTDLLIAGQRRVTPVGINTRIARVHGFMVARLAAQLAERVRAPLHN